MNRTLAEIIEDKDKIIDDLMREVKYKDKEIERLKYYENLLKEVRDWANKDDWGC